MTIWISHMMIADNLLNRGLDFDKNGFCDGMDWRKTTC